MIFNNKRILSHGPKKESTCKKAKNSETTAVSQLNQ